MARYPLFGTETRGKSLHYSAQRRINLYAEIKQEGDRSKLAFYSRPGLTLFADLGDTPVRGLHVFGSLLYAVHRGVFYEINNAGVATARGTLNTTSGKVSMANNGTQVIVVDGTDGWTWNIGTTTWAEITDADFPTANTVAFQGGFFIVDNANTGQFHISASYDGTAYDATEFATAESSPDDLVRVFVDRGELILFGAYTTEYWSNIGAVDFPFARIDGAVIEWGLAARWSVARLDNTIAYLAQNRMGEVQIVRLSGYQPQRLSNEEVEHTINGYTVTSDASAFAYISGGHQFYQINFPTAGKSWIYNLQAGDWLEAQYGTTGARHRGELGEQFLSKTIIADYESGKLYRVDDTVQADNGMSFACEIVGRHVFDEEPVSIGRLWLDIDSGTGTATGAGNNPQAMLAISKDGGRTWGPERYADIGEIGEYKTRVMWRRLGRAYDWTMRVRIADPVKIAISGAWVDAA